MKYFSIEELTRSSVAQSKGIDNTPSIAQQTNLKELIVNVLDPIRQQWGSPISVNSGFRSGALNVAVGGAPNSQHMQGQAADVTTGSRERNRMLYDLILSFGVEFDQLIDENDCSWIHISYVRGANRNSSFKLG